MIYLLLAILSSSLVAIAMRLGKQYCENDISMLAVNYVFCTIFAACYTGVGHFHVERSSIGLGIIQGVLYLASFVVYQYNIQKNGVVLSASFMKLGVLVPTLAAIFLFREQPTLLQILGVGLSVAAIVLMNYEKSEQKFQLKIALFGLLILGGVTDFMAKVYEQYGDPEFKNQFIFYTFLTALILCIALTIYKKEKLTKRDILCGTMISIPNYFSAVFLLKAVHYVMATVAYSSFSVGSIACVTVAGILLFKERLTAKQGIGLLIIVAALICLNFR